MQPWSVGHIDQSAAQTVKVSASYTGPGNVQSGALGWWGLRGYTAAYSTGSNPAIDLTDQDEANPITINILANGRLDVASISAWVTAHSVSIIEVQKLYDQSGAGLHLTANDATVAPTLVLNVLSGYPVVRCVSGTGHWFKNTTGLTRAQPFFLSWVAARTAFFSSINAVFGSNSAGVQSGFANATNQVFSYASGSIPTAAATDSSFHAVQQNFNGSSSDIMVNGTANTGLDPGTTGLSGTFSVAGNSTAASLNGDFMECGVWAGTISGGTETNLNTNQHGTNGYNWV